MDHPLQIRKDADGVVWLSFEGGLFNLTILAQEQKPGIFRRNFQTALDKIVPSGTQSLDDLANAKFGVLANTYPTVQAEPSALDRQVGGNHYKQGGIQPVQYIEANKLPFLEGCVVKRLTRHDKEGGKGRIDIEKCIHECQLILELRYDQPAHVVSKG